MLMMGGGEENKDLFSEKSVIRRVADIMTSRRGC
jgi:hypothetical protein